MASATINSDRFPVGTSVSAYKRSDFPGVPEVPSGAPSGLVAVSTATVASDGSLTFSGLADDTKYAAYASVSGQDRYVFFRSAPLVGSTSPDATDVGDDLVPVAGQSNPVGIGENFDAVRDTVDGRIFQLGGTPNTTYFQQRVQAVDPLMHHLPQPAPACVGFAMSFGREYVKTLVPNRSLQLLPCAHGSTGFSDTTNSWDPAFVATPGVTTNLYNNLLAQIDAGLALNPNNRVTALLWHQGEGDTNFLDQAGYTTRLLALIDGVRAHVGNPNLPVVIGPMVPERVEGNINAGYPLVNAAHRDIQRLRTNVWWFQGPRNSYNSAANGGTIHYNASGQRKLGAGDPTVPGVIGYFKALQYAKANVLGTAPPVPTNLTLTQSGTGVTASWLPGRGRTTSYKVQADTGSGMTDVTRATDIATLMNPSQAFAGLTLGSTISVRAAALNEQGQSAWSAPVSLTLATIPAQVTGLTAGTSGSNRQDLTWNAVTGGTGAATSYLVEYKRHADSSWTTFGSVTTNAASVTGLLTGTSYDYRVTAVNAAGSGTPSATQTVSTTALAVLATAVGTDMAVGYSTARKLRTAYAGSAIRVRRSSDSTEQDIGFDANGNLDEAAMLTFVGAGDGFVKTIYNQGTQASSDLTQTTTTLQPKIVTAGVTEKVGGVPMASFTGTQYLAGAFQSLYAANGAATVLMVAQRPATAAAMYVYTEDNAGTAGGTYSPLAYTSAGLPLFNDGSVAQTPAGGVTFTDDGSLSQFTSLDSGASGSNAKSVTVDGVAKVAKTGLTRPTVTISATTFGARRSGGANAFFTGHIAEIVGWTSALTTQQLIDGPANQKGFYGTP